MPRYAKTIPVAIAIQLLVNLNVVFASPISQTSPFPTSVHTPRSVQQLQSGASSAETSVQQTAASLNSHKCPQLCILDGQNLCDALEKSEKCPTNIPVEQWNDCKNALSSQLGGFTGDLPANAPSKGSESSVVPESGKAGPTGASSGGSVSVDAGSDKPSASGFQAGGPSKGSDPSSVGVSLGSSKSSQTGASSGGSVTVDAGPDKPSDGGFQAGGPSKGSDPSSVGVSPGASVGLGKSSNIEHPSVPNSGGAARPTDSNRIGSTSVSIPDSGQASSGAIPSGSISLGSTTVSIPSTDVPGGVDDLGSKGSSSGSGVFSIVSPTLGGESKGNGAPGNNGGEGGGCGCGDEIPI
ncbi:hypothetical protein GYMLUDRAFT_37916, partial [Collybiopsis luxurians FD-317 M1]